MEADPTEAGGATGGRGPGSVTAHADASGDARAGAAEASGGGSSWWARALLGLFVALAVAVVAVTNALLTQRYTEATRNASEVKLAAHIGGLLAELRKNQVVPLLLSRDPELVGSLQSGDYSMTSGRLISYQGEIGADTLMLLDADGRTVAATERERIGESHVRAAFRIAALRSSDTVFTRVTEEGRTRFFYSRKLTQGRRTLGVIVVGVDLRRFEARWRGVSDAVMVTDSTGQVILSTEPRWRGLDAAEALEVQSAPSATERAIRSAAEFLSLPVESYFGGGVIEVESRIPFRGWSMTVFTRYASVRERVNGVLALQITAFATVLAIAFYMSSRSASVRVRLFQRESAGLRALNERLSREIAERERAQADLSAAEATLAQSSKLAALGEMSAAVSHELNQPLAAMKTYLAGARLLLQRRRADEALASVQRIDDLIERMGAITRQLKSYARKGGTAFEPVDLRAALSSALAMMEPQLKTRAVTVARSVPQHPVMVRADRLRLEQVIINLLRNALDATQGVEAPQVDVILASGRRATLTVRDNGHGIEDLDALFEPFYTTKKAADGVGLGLAISSGIVQDHGGRLTARNAASGGAVFEIRLPLMGEDAGSGAVDGKEAPARGARGGGVPPRGAEARGAPVPAEAAE